MADYSVAVYMTVIMSEVELSTTVKQFHARLRADLKAGRKDVGTLWKELLEDRSSLSKYAIAMHALATGPWAKHSVAGGGGRIEWCVEICHEYFQGGQLKKMFLKDLRRLEHKMPTVLDVGLLTSLPGDHEIEREFVQRPWRLLDVGSCYNPFADQPHFDVTAVDVAPAVETVWECDFTSVNIVQTPSTVLHPVPSKSQPPLSSESDCSKDAKPVTITDKSVSPCYAEHRKLPRKFCPDLPNVNKPRRAAVPSRGRGHLDQLPSEWYDVVIFSLLLSYLPATSQRLQCCVNAHKVLRPHGLLLIVTPDSSHQNRHAGMMKDWKACIEGLGFSRWRYVKNTHLHCMAFRKTRLTPDYGHLMHTHVLLSIPQDSQELAAGDGDREAGKVEDSRDFHDLVDQELPFGGFTEA